MMRLKARQTTTLHTAAAVLALLCLLATPSARAADTVRASTAEGYARLLFAFEPATHVTAQVTGQVLTIAFDRKVSIEPSTIAQSLPGYIASARADADGKTFRFALSQPVRVHTSSSSGKTAVDLAPPGFAGTPPDLPPPPKPAPKIVDISKLETLKVRSGAYQNFTRVVFDWPRNVPYTVFPGARRLTVRFEALVKPDFSAIERQIPPWVKAASWRIEGSGTIVELETDSDSGFHDFRDGTHIVVDVLAPKTETSAYRPPGDARPSVTAFAPNKNDKKSAVVTPAQAQAVAAAATKLNTPPGTARKLIVEAPQKLGPNAPKQNVAAQQNTPVAAVPNDQTPANAEVQKSQPAQPSSETQAAESKLTPNGAVLIFPEAGRRGAVVFMRGATAWIVLQNAGPLDVAKLKSQLGAFPDTVEASTGDGVAVLRIALKNPERISATTEGANLKVVISPSASTKAITIDFSRNQDDPNRSSLFTILPGAEKPITLVDPAVGDELIVIPGIAGRAVLNERVYVEFAALQTAAGVVLTPYVDDLSVSVNASRLVVTRKGGLTLSAPTASIDSAMGPQARSANGPSFLDFAKWGKISGGSFLATERRLRLAAARLKSEDANRARLALAQFYLANSFSAEALGLINLMQSVNPALQSDQQLQTMRAAADYRMGRYRDAHNTLAGLQFDSDNHAALWRGLTEAALGNWSEAHANLERANYVLDRYQPDIQVQARLADAKAALELGRLNIADKLLERLPAPMTNAQTLEAKLLRARLYAATSRQRKADRLFAEVENGGNDRLAAEAIYYRVTTALGSGSISPASAINALERLRFRWRGDRLELDTLHKLASLYFAQKHWRDGLATLRVAVRNFPNDDLGLKAQDDMRAAFVDLFLKGKADSMPPVAALALFYDFLDLTPIGPDGDEMIRRMTDRLVGVDLLGPASELLQYQVTKRLDGMARAQVATKLAMIQLMDRKPQAALDTLRSTRISTLPDDVNHQRLLLEARALAETKQWDDAIDLIAVDNAPDTVRLRAEIYWQSGNWAIAAQKSEQALGTRWGDAVPLTPDERREVMRAAVAYSLANDEASLERLRDRYSIKMKQTPDASAFVVVTQRIDMHGMAFREAAALVASIDTLQTFMKDLQKPKPGKN